MSTAAYSRVTALTSPVHIDDQANLSTLFLLEFFAVYLDSSRMREDQVVTNNERFGVRVAFWGDAAIRATTGCVFTKAMAEEGIDVWFWHVSA
jgi:hypothetical protein